MGLFKPSVVAPEDGEAHSTEEKRGLSGWVRYKKHCVAYMVQIDLRHTALTIEAAQQPAVFCSPVDCSHHSANVQIRRNPVAASVLITLLILGLVAAIVVPVTCSVHGCPPKKQEVSVALCDMTPLTVSGKLYECRPAAPAAPGARRKTRHLGLFPAQAPEPRGSMTNRLSALCCPGYICRSPTEIHSTTERLHAWWSPSSQT